MTQVNNIVDFIFLSNLSIGLFQEVQTPEFSVSESRWRVNSSFSTSMSRSFIEAIFNSIVRSTKLVLRTILVIGSITYIDYHQR